MDARLIDPETLRLVPVRDMLDAPRWPSVSPHALALGCLDALDRVQRISFANGAERQRAVAAASGRLEDLVAGLADQFRPAPGAAASAPARANRNPQNTQHDRKGRLMCRWLAYSGSPILLQEALYGGPNSLVDQSLHSRLGRRADQRRRLRRRLVRRP